MAICPFPLFLNSSQGPVPVGKKENLSSIAEKMLIPGKGDRGQQGRHESELRCVMHVVREPPHDLGKTRDVPVRGTVSVPRTHLRCMATGPVLGLEATEVTSTAKGKVRVARRCQWPFAGLLGKEGQ